MNLYIFRFFLFTSVDFLPFFFNMADAEDDVQLPDIGDIVQDLPVFDEENGFEPVSPGKHRIS